MSDECKFIVDFLNCEYELFSSETNPNDILERFNQLTEQGNRDGFYPLIVIPSDTLVDTLEIFVEDNNVENTPESIAACRQTAIDAANAADVGEFLSARLSEAMKIYSGGSHDILGKFVQAAPQSALTLQTLTEESSGEVLIAKIPTANPWELAAWMPMGGFNECPAPAEQVAIFRYWYEKYGAVPAAVSYDTWQMTLARPPATEGEAEALAREQFAFCADIVEQGAETIRGLASILKGAAVWFFWWD